jgi:hypothetical protein
MKIRISNTDAEQKHFSMTSIIIIIPVRADSRETNRFPIKTCGKDI